MSSPKIATIITRTALSRLKDSTVEMEAMFLAELLTAKGWYVRTNSSLFLPNKRVLSYSPVHVVKGIDKELVLSLEEAGHSDISEVVPAPTPDVVQWGLEFLEQHRIFLSKEGNWKLRRKLYGTPANLSLLYSVLGYNSAIHSQFVICAVEGLVPVLEVFGAPVYSLFDSNAVAKIKEEIQKGENP